ncbi:MAG TPA: phosphopentomutase [Nitrospiraceae bacterium]|nr:phosphopentomutase [Nitrospiraceae bacterium]
MITRVFLLVLDGLGIGALPDAARYGDADADTLSHLCEAAGGIRLPNLENLGLGHLGNFLGVRPITQPEGCFGRLGFASRGKDSLAGHWEIACWPLEEDSGVGSEFTSALAELVEGAIGRKTLGNRVLSLLEEIDESVAEHRRSGSPIVWIDDVGAVHLAAQDTVISAEELYRMARDIRRAAKARFPVLRVIAHPFNRHAGSLASEERRRHFATEPQGPTLLDQLSRASQLVIGVGKVGDLFSGRGITRSTAVSGYREALDEVLGLFGRVPRGLLFTNLEILSPGLEETVHALQEVDRRLIDFREKLKTGDVLMITADHGYDMSRPIPGHSREYAPLLIIGPRLARGVNLGTRSTAADLGQTIGEALGAARMPVGDSFLNSLRAG